MTEVQDAGAALGRKSWITSEKLSRPAVIASWAIAVLLLSSGMTATFLSKPGAAAATMVALGGLLVLVALMQRIPLRLEVAGAKFDASYPQDLAYDAGREGGVVQGLEAALQSAERSDAPETEVKELVVLLRNARDEEIPWADVGQAGEEAALPDHNWPDRNERFGYTGPSACAAAGITYRQLDYWTRTGLLQPTGIPSSPRSAAKRLYTAEDITIAAVAKRLLSTGISMPQIRMVISRLGETSAESWDQLTLMSDGRSLYEATSVDEVIDLVQGGEGIFGVSVGRVHREVLDRLRGSKGQPIF